ncbi:hypothetical protein BJ508DRAFT_78977 [Ascobolus immersus RN42]|uniref:Uncharacterized protein n=1 Tax=Ascobolus immersus RN42 TaxID=1160509 RepID=A0A3N4HHE0_ASCIM|nr:hypothetical protein BJ508DRAFT_78977 [Ascobolus immersus RN42]
MDPVEMAASLIAQLLRTATSDDDAMRMMRILRKELHDSSFFAQSQAQGGGRDYHRLCCMFLDMVSITQRKVKIVLDAMDECIQPDFVAEFVQLVDASVSALEEGDEDAASSQTPPIQFLLTGRPNVDHFYSSISTISTIRMDVDADIKKLVEEKVNKNTALQAHKDVIIDTIYKNSAGMFRYAALVLAELERYSPRPIEERLRTMPKGIFGIYELILTRLGADGDEHNREMRRRILMLCMVPNFCTFSSVDNAVSMLQHLCSIHPGEPSFDPSRAIPPTKEQLLSSCGSLVELRQSSTDDSSKCGKRKKSESEDVFEISFTHRTVREFLLRNRDDLSPEAAQNDFLFPLLTTVADSRLYICLCMLTGLLSIHSCPDSFYERASNSVYRNASGFLTGRGGLAVLAIENRERKSSDLSKFWELMARFIWDIRFVKHFTAFLFACRTENAFDGSAPRIRLMGPWMSMFKGMIRKEVLSIPPETLLGLYDLDEILKRYRPQLFSVTDWRLDLIDACEVRIRYDWDATKDCFTQPYMYPWTSVVIMHAVAIGRDAHDMAHELWDREDETYEVYSLLQISAFCESVHTGRLVMESYRALNDPSKAVHDAALSFLATIEPVVCAFEYFPDNIAAMLAEYPEILNSYEIVRFMKRTPLSLVVKLFNDLHNHKGNCFCCEDLSDSLTHFTPEPAEDPSAFDFFWSEKTGVMFDLKDPMRSFNSCDGRGGRVGDDDDDGFSAAVGLIRHGDSTYLQILYRKLRELGLKTLGEIGLFLPIDWEDIEEVEGELIYKHADAFASETQSLTSVDSFATANEDPVDEFYSSEEEDEPGKADGSEPDSSNEMYSSEEEDGMELEEGEKIGPDSSDEIHSSDGEDEMEEADEGEPTSVETIDFSAPEIPETELSGPA